MWTIGGVVCINMLELWVLLLWSLDRYILAFNTWFKFRVDLSSIWYSQLLAPKTLGEGSWSVYGYPNIWLLLFRKGGAREIFCFEVRTKFGVTVAALSVHEGAVGGRYEVLWRAKLWVVLYGGWIRRLVPISGKYLCKFPQEYLNGYLSILSRCSVNIATLE